MCEWPHASILLSWTRPGRPPLDSRLWFGEATLAEPVKLSELMKKNFRF